MNLLPTGTEDIVADSGQTIGAVTTQSVSALSFTILAVTYVPGASYTSDIYYKTIDQSLSIVENTESENLSDLTCSLSGSTSISFSISNYATTVAPSWITIDSLSGVLKILTPEVDSDAEFNFYINSAINGFSMPVKKFIKLTVINCITSN